MFIALTALAIVVANILNIVVVSRARIGSEPARVFIISLALADILIGALAFTSTFPSGSDGYHLTIHCVISSVLPSPLVYFSACFSWSVSVLIASSP